MSTTLPGDKPVKYLVCASDTPEARAALKLACLKAKSCGGLVDVLHVIPPADFQTLSGIADRMRDEQHEAAERLLQSIAEEAYDSCGIRPSLIVREGQIGDAIITVATEDPDIDMLVIGVSEAKGRGTLVSWLAAQLGNRLPVPLLLVPGTLTDQQLQALA